MRANDRPRRVALACARAQGEWRARRVVSGVSADRDALALTKVGTPYTPPPENAPRVRVSTQLRNASRRASAAARRAASADALAGDDDGERGVTSSPPFMRRAPHLARSAGLSGDRHAEMSHTEDGSASASVWSASPPPSSRCAAWRSGSSRPGGRDGMPRGADGGGRPGGSMAGEAVRARSWPAARAAAALRGGATERGRCSSVPGVLAKLVPQRGCERSRQPLSQGSAPEQQQDRPSLPPRPPPPDVHAPRARRSGGEASRRDRATVPR
jgi:hypothetical protein